MSGEDKDFESIRERIKKCRLCRLCELGAKQAVPGEGNPRAQVMFIGEAPGRDEDEQGRPFVGAAGKFLTQMLELAGYKREDVFITNVVKHRPPQNRDPLPDEIETCWPYLEAQIKAIKPKLIVLLGRHAMGRFLPGLKISQVHGRAKRAKGIWSEKQVYFPVYHPAAALYNPGLREVHIRDMKKIPVLLKKI
jgi:uracil-DNA glycosylase